jgi:MFS transporter, FHS family, L-fucose permease
MNLHDDKVSIVFLTYLSAVIAFTAASITQRGNTGFAMLMLTLFFESVVFPTIVALGMRGVGQHTKRASGWIVGGVAGGACVPAIMAAVADRRNSTAFAMIIPTMFYLQAYMYALAVNFIPAYRDPADAIGHSDVELGITDTAFNMVFDNAL